MADPPPEGLSVRPPPVSPSPQSPPLAPSAAGVQQPAIRAPSGNPQPVFAGPNPSTEAPLHPVAELPSSTFAAAAELAVLPPAGIPLAGEPCDGLKAAPSKVPPPRPSLAVLPRKIKKKKNAKNASKAHPHLIPNDEIAEVVRPTQSIAADEVSINENDEEMYSDEEEEEFDIEEYQVSDEKRLELARLMEKYDVYDEEQLRLAIRRERKEEKFRLPDAGEPLPSPDSAPASPSHLASRFVPHPYLILSLIMEISIPQN